MKRDLSNNDSYRFILLLITVISLIIPAVTAAEQVELEVMHWWTSPAEQKAIRVIQSNFEKKNYIWKDEGIKGGAGGPMVEKVKNRIAVGNPPGAAQALMGYHLWQWAERDVLTSLNQIARNEHWDDILPDSVKRMIQYKGNYIAVPISVHRVNWMWTNREIFNKTGAVVPTTWDEFFISAEKIKKAGFIPVTMGEDPWQVAALFDAVALGIGNIDFYQKAFIQLDPVAIQGPTMKKVFEMMRRIRSYTNPVRREITWDMATGMLINGQAAMQFMGDWVKGEVLIAGKTPGREIGCSCMPETQDMFLFNVDTFTMFKTDNTDILAAQEQLARTILEPEVQQLFSLYKGSIPVRIDVGMEKFDICGQMSGKDFKAAQANRALVPSFAFGLSTPPDVRNVMLDLINKHFDSDMTAEEAVKKLAVLVKISK